ncbi:hypothetical protein FPV67DRAFT_636385 [Lyophyllum atratum]|nr:hypothetical protein FPV67DRAFT_636385 [Lyophyllum atratum]
MRFQGRTTAETSVGLKILSLLSFRVISLSGAVAVKPIPWGYSTAHVVVFIIWLLFEDVKKVPHADPIPTIFLLKLPNLPIVDWGYQCLRASDSSMRAPGPPSIIKNLPHARPPRP